VPSATIASDPELSGGNLPVFLAEPVNSYVVKKQPATLHCKAAHALQVYFRCNGQRIKDHFQQDFVDPHTGTRIIESELNITRNQIEEYFSKDRFKCECIAWSGSGQINSQPATIDVACEYTTSTVPSCPDYRGNSLARARDESRRRL
jgi:netrin receptor unc-5